ncbi:hypothetical protein AcV7_006168 [Taiwanofungus camphoratus]|nr:hypothetical protein AcV7_006168 [Antrodia cinnamomea]
MKTALATSLLEKQKGAREHNPRDNCGVFNLDLTHVVSDSLLFSEGINAPGLAGTHTSLPVHQGRHSILAPRQDSASSTVVRPWELICLMREGEVTYKLPDLIAIIQAVSQYLLLYRALHHGGVEVRESRLCAMDTALLRRPQSSAS